MHTHTHTCTCELGGPIDVVYEVLPAVRSVADLPALPQVPQLLGVDAHVSEPGVVPGAHACGTVDEVHLSLGRGPLLWGEIQAQCISYVYTTVDLDRY